MISLENISIANGKFKLENISLTIPTRRYGILMGKTGCGKTTLLETICGLKKIQSGCIRLMGRDVTHTSPSERGIGYVPQDCALFTHMTVYGNLAFALEIRKLPVSQIKTRVFDLAELLGILHLLERHPIKLSGGEAQRVAIGRALSHRPAILCMDEPLSALDDDTRTEMYTLLKTVQTHTGVTTLHVTHNRSEADHLGDIVFRMEDGKILPVKVNKNNNEKQ